MPEHKYEDRFYGPDRIKAVKPAGTTRNGSELVELFFENGKSEVVAKAMLDSEGVLTPEISDYTLLRTARLYPVVKDILTLMLGYNIKKSEVQHLVQLTLASFNENLDKADRVLWKTKELEEISMHTIDQVITLGESKTTLKDVLGSEAE